MSRYRISRYHDISTGHRVHGHESKCAHLHGHNYRVHFHCEPRRSLDALGRVIDFGVVKERLCEWLEREWDHRFLVGRDDPLAEPLQQLDPTGTVIVDFNPTAERMAEHLVTTVGPRQLHDTDVVLVGVDIEETRKCAASYWLERARHGRDPASEMIRP